MSRRGHLLALAESSVLETGFKSESSDRFFVGSSPFGGDFGTAGTPIPTAQLTGTARYLFCLAQYPVPRGEKAILWGIRQLLTIGNLYPNGSGGFQRINLPVEDDWSFPDGDVSWHLRWIPGDVLTSPKVPTPDPAAPLGTSPNLYAAGSLLYTPPFVPYVAPNGGMPLGDPILGLATFYDVRYPAHGHGARSDLAWECPGGGTIAIYASVRQTDPLTRPKTTIPDAALPFVRKQDAFVQTMVQTVERATFAPVYDTIGATLVIETDAIGRSGDKCRPGLEIVK